MSEIHCLKVLKQLFENSESKLWLSFVHSLFHETIKVTEGDDKCTTESELAVKAVLLKLQTCCDKHFILHVVKMLLTDLVHDGEMMMQRYFRTTKEFYDTALSYLEGWNKHNEDLHKLSCLLLDNVPKRENSDVIDLLSSEW
jgi:hypothetical protein